MRGYMRGYMRDYYKKNKEKILASQKEYHEKKKEAQK